MKHFLFAALIATAAPVAPLLAQEQGVAQRLPTQPLLIRSGAATHRYQVEVARTGQEQATGLMFRTVMAADRGMIFPMRPARVASFWMKNTWIPLDLVFIRKDGTISSIAANATPRSLDPIASVEPVVAVLELNGGEAARQGIKAGDRVRWNG